MLLCFCFDIQNNICTQHVVNLYFSWNSMNNLLLYCGLTGARMRASEKDLPVQKGAFRLDLVPTNCIPYGSILIERYLCQTYLRAVQPIFDESWTNFVQTNLFNLHNHVSRLVFEGQVFLLSYAKYCDNIKLLKKEETYVKSFFDVTKFSWKTART